MSSSATAKPPALRGDRSTEMPKVLRITPQEPFRFLSQTENPFRATFLHPARSTGETSRKKIDGATDANRDRHAERAVMHVDPFLLFRAAEADEEEIWLSAHDAIANFLVIHLQKLVKGW